MVILIIDQVNHFAFGNTDLSLEVCLKEEPKTAVSKKHHILFNMVPTTALGHHDPFDGPWYPIFVLYVSMYLHLPEANEVHHGKTYDGRTRP